MSNRNYILTVSNKSEILHTERMVLNASNVGEWIIFTDSNGKLFFHPKDQFPKGQVNSFDTTLNYNFKQI